MSEDTPFLSIVTTSRNDDHGGHLLERTQFFINSLSDQCKQYELETELIIVEWNPPEENKRLHEILQFPRNHEFLTVRIITVPKEIHITFKYSDQLPLFQMIGKNVGIRRAHGQFILASNTDIIFSDKLFEWISRKEINPDTLYRVDRLDVTNLFSEWFRYFFSQSTVNLKEYCKRNIIRINKKYGTFPSKKQTGIKKYYYYKLHTFAVYLLRKYFLRNANKIPFFGFIHTNGCGDFTLMAKDLWHRFMAYPELEMFSWNIDSLLLILAYHFGVKEVDLPSPLNIYHMEHGSGWTPGKGEELLFKRLEEKKIPVITWEDCISISQLLDQSKMLCKSIHLNKENWGLVDIKLEEKIIG